MKEKDIKRKKEIIDISSINDTLQVTINENFDHLFLLKQLHRSTRNIKKEIRITFTKPNISSNINVRMVLDRPIEVQIEIVIIAKEGIAGVESKLDMRALLIDKNASIQFTPSLEIDEMDVSIDHKSSIGSPSKEWLEYLSSRGLNFNDSIKLLKKAFINEE